MALSKDPQPSMYADKLFAQKLRRRKGQMWRQMCVRVRVRVVRFFFVYGCFCVDCVLRTRFSCVLANFLLLLIVVNF